MRNEKKAMTFFFVTARNKNDDIHTPLEYLTTGMSQLKIWSVNLILPFVYNNVYNFFLNIYIKINKQQTIFAVAK